MDKPSSHRLSQSNVAVTNIGMLQFKYNFQIFTAEDHYHKHIGDKKKT